MLVHVKRDELLAIAAQTAKAAPKTATSEAVLGIHVEADSRRSMLTLTATNYEIVIRASMGASVEQSGSVVISAALFPAAIASLPEQDVDLETEHPGQLTIRSGHARFRLSALSGDKYPMPELPFPDDTLPVSGLRSLARNTLFAVAEDGVPSPPMKCVRLHVGPDGLKASASNGFCIMEADGDKQCKGQIELLLPARSLKVLASLSNDSDVYEMGVTGKSLVFWSGTLLFSARLVEGKFPNTSGIFEQFKCQYSVHLDAAEFIRALEVAESVSESNHRVELTFGEHEITVSAESACGRSSAPVKALVLNAPKQPFYYNSRKLLEYLRLEKEKITLEFDKFGLLVVRSGSTRYGDAFESMYILAKGKPKTVHILKDKPNKWAGTKTWGCLTKREVNGTLTPKGRKTIQKFGARTNVWHYGTVLPMESELFGGKAVSLSERLAEDHIRTWSNEGDLVLAPFDKDGTVAKIAPLLERRWLSLQNAADCDGLRDNAG